MDISVSDEPVAGFVEIKISFDESVNGFAQRVVAHVWIPGNDSKKIVRDAAFRETRDLLRRALQALPAEYQK